MVDDVVADVRLDRPALFLSLFFFCPVVPTTVSIYERPFLIYTNIYGHTYRCRAAGIYLLKRKLEFLKKRRPQQWQQHRPSVRPIWSRLTLIFCLKSPTFSLHFFSMFNPLTERKRRILGAVLL